jgi:hypothetical protein
MMYSSWRISWSVPALPSVLFLQVFRFLLLADAMFRRWVGFAEEGRSDPDWPANVLVSVLLVGADARPVRFHRWIQWELMRLREDAVARCVRPVTPP